LFGQQSTLSLQIKSATAGAIGNHPFISNGAKSIHCVCLFVCEEEE
jgi:hypothetical protein